MGTRSLTIVKDERNNTIVTLYRQYDGYPEGHGQELANFLSEFDAVTDEFAGGETRKTANGMGCLAAQLVAYLKDGVGNVYLEPTGTLNVGEEWVYTIRRDGKSIRMKVQAGIVSFFGFQGTPNSKMPVVWEGLPIEYDAIRINEEYQRRYEEMKELANADGS